jgi:hypothetical protein
MPAGVLLWRGQVLLALATASAGQISFRCWRPGPAASGAAGTLPAAAAGPAGPGLRACRCGLVTPAAGVLASLLAVPGAAGPACRPAGGTRPAPAVKPTRRLSRRVSFRQAVAGVCCAPADSVLLPMHTSGVTEAHRSAVRSGGPVAVLGRGLTTDGRRASARWLTAGALAAIFRGLPVAGRGRARSAESVL